MFKRSILVVALFFLLIGSAFAKAPGEGKEVQPARATWTTGFFLEALYSRALEDLGYDVMDPKDLSNPVFYQAVCQGDVDFWANGWFPLHNEQLPENFKEMAKIAGTIVEAGAIQGYLVSKKHVEEFNILSLEDFKRDEVKKAFDANDDGKADLVACPPGWGCEKVITYHLEAYGLNDHFNAIKAGYSASMADAIARYQSGKAIIFYTWTPNWTVFKLKPGEDVMWINVPEINPTPGQVGFEEAMVQRGVEGAVTDPVKMGFVANDISVVANLKFLEENPAAEKMFEIMSVPLTDIAQQNNKMFEGEDSPKDIEKHVNEWIKNNKEHYDEWLNEAMEAANKHAKSESTLIAAGCQGPEKEESEDNATGSEQETGMKDIGVVVAGSEEGEEDKNSTEENNEETGMKSSGIIVASAHEKAEELADDMKEKGEEVEEGEKTDEDGMIIPEDEVTEEVKKKTEQLQEEAEKQE